MIVDPKNKGQEVAKCHLINTGNADFFFTNKREARVDQ